VRTNNLNKVKRIIDFWILFALAVILVRRLIVSRFTFSICIDNFLQELFIGIISSIVVGIFIGINKWKKELKYLISEWSIPDLIDT
jgi:hypothetical protein